MLGSFLAWIQRWWGRVAGRLEGSSDRSDGAHTHPDRCARRFVVGLVCGLAGAVIVAYHEPAMQIQSVQPTPNPNAFKFITDVPADWEQSIALAGEPGDFVAFARQARGGSEWYIGAVADEQKRELNLPLDFLEEGVSYTAEIYRDGPDAHFREQPYDIVIEQRVVSRGDSMALTLAPGGGAAVRLAPAGD